jgi:parvulin-like peptidyl-prolyl isomerase
MAASVRTTLVAVVAAALVAAPLAAQALLDRVAARVNGNVILLSDVRAAVMLGLIDAPLDSEDAVEQMVQRALLIEEVNRFPPPDPPADAVDAEVERLRARAGGSLEAVERATGLSPQYVRLLARDRLRIQAYIDGRFGVTVPLTDEQVLQYYRDHPEEFTSGGQVVAFERAQGVARERAGLEQRRRTINQWLGDLRVRADISVPAR